MGKASKRKKRGFENRDAQGSDFGEVVLPSIFTRYGFLLALFLITITAFLIYSNTFASPFHFDDEPNIVENYKSRDLSNFWPPSGTRYIGFLSFAINYHFGSLNVFGYHLVNIIIHIINSILVWWLVILTFRTPVMERINTNPQLRYFIAITASLLFVSHPIQTQAVTYIVQRFASLATLFYLLSLTLYIKAKLQTIQVEAKDENKFFSTSTLTFYLLSLISAILAMKTKEIAFTLPFVVLLYEFMFFTPHPSRAFGTEGGGIAIGMKQSLFVKRILYLIPLLLTLFIIPLSLIGTDKPVGDMIGELREAAQETEEISRGVYLLTQFKVIVTYIRLLFLPINQNLDYDYPLSHSLFEPQTFASFLFLSAIFAFTVYLFIRSRKTDNRHGLLISFGILWFFITLSVESSIIPIRDVIFEHRLYLPSIGAVIAFSAAVFYGVSYTKKNLVIKTSLLLTTCVLLLVTAFPLGVTAYKRNFVWKDEVTLWEDVVRKSPNKARGYNNLGGIYYTRQRINEAQTEYELALRLNPDYAEAHYNFGVLYEGQGRVNDAIRLYKEALRLKPNYIKAHNNLGVVYYKTGQIDEAIKEYLIVLRLKPSYVITLNNLGLAYSRKGRLDEAIREYETALNFQPDYAEAYYNLGNAYYYQGKMDEAIKEYITALRLKPDYADAYNNLGSAYARKEMFEMAIQEFRMALDFKPDYVAAHLNLGLTYQKMGLRNEAVTEFKEVLKIQPDYIEVQKILESLSR